MTTRFDNVDELLAANDAYDGTKATAEHIVPGYAYDPEVNALWVVLPTGVFSRLPTGGSGWQVEQHDDGTITVTPSIWNHGGGDLRDWHGWLTRGHYVSC